MIDLHSHTSASDGSLAPADLVDLALETGLTALAVTDHDTVDGLAEAQSRAAGTTLELIPGVELALQYPAARFHLLGYFIDADAPELKQRLQRLQFSRAARNSAMIARLNDLGLTVTMDDVARISGGGEIGRPHFAMALMQQGVVNSVQEAFDRFLADGALAHIPKDKIGLDEGLFLVHQAGGVACLAHPLTLGLRDDALATELVRLHAMGLDALECYYSAHTQAENSELLQMAHTVGLAPTGGSDFHGAAKPHIKLGAVCNGAPAPQALLDGLRQRQATNRR